MSSCHTCQNPHVCWQISIFVALDLAWFFRVNLQETGFFLDMGLVSCSISHWIGLRENLQETFISHGGFQKKHGLP